MKRFFCTECKKVKRVRNLPNNVRGQKFGPVTSHAINPTDRIGKCDSHNRKEVR